MSVTYVSSPISHILSEFHSLPADKSMSHRAALFAALATGQSKITRYSDGADCQHTLTVLSQLGVQIKQEGSTVVIDSVGELRPSDAPLDCGNAGTLCRLLLGILAATPGRHQLTGDSSLSARPMRRVLSPLQAMGAEFEAKADGLPLTVIGRPLTAIDYEMPVASAQLKSALLLAGLRAQGSTTIHSPGVSRDHTERLLSALGVELVASEQSLSIVGGQSVQTLGWVVPGDFSAAAFWLVLAAGLGVPLRMTGVGLNATRTGLLPLLEKMGAKICVEIEDETIEPVGSISLEPGALHGIKVSGDEVNLAIDEMPIFCVLAAVAKGRTVISGASELKVKESDRLAMMAQGLSTLGIQINTTEDGLIIEGGSLQGGTVQSGGDHRIAMSFIIAGALAKAPVAVCDNGSIETSYREFMRHAGQFGLEVTEKSDAGE